MIRNAASIGRRGFARTRRNAGPSVRRLPGKHLARCVAWGEDDGLSEEARADLAEYAQQAFDLLHRRSTAGKIPLR